MALLALDIGGSAVKYAVWSEEKLHEKAEFPTPKLRSSFFDELKKIKAELEATYQLEGVAVSLPGEPDEASGVIKGFSFVPFLHVLPIKEAFEEELGLPVSLYNDADSAALAEMTYGIGKGAKNPLFVILGTGIGLAVVEAGKVIPASDLVTNFDQKAADAFASLKNRQITLVHVARKVSVKKFKLPSSIDGKTVFELADEGDQVAQTELTKLYENLADVLTALQFAFKPEFIGIGGGISNNDSFVPALKETLDEKFANQKENVEWFKTVFSTETENEDPELTKPDIRASHYKNDANLLGAVIHFQQTQEKENI